jgi:hypothetical protein
MIVADSGTTAVGALASLRILIFLCTSVSNVTQRRCKPQTNRKHFHFQKVLKMAFRAALTDCPEAGLPVRQGIPICIPVLITAGVLCKTIPLKRKPGRHDQIFSSEVAAVLNWNSEARNWFLSLWQGLHSARFLSSS